ncbi:hypothetical protein VNO77_16219 [Canavalia gladiata]|uniref:Uncharacterized protein n=1 Tax=Canavalia gladiata TaxID=3824 RepID=A0AAN9M0M9_CANGL
MIRKRLEVLRTMMKRVSRLCIEDSIISLCVRVYEIMAQGLLPTLYFGDHKVVQNLLVSFTSLCFDLPRILKAHSFEAMPKTNENVETPAANTVRIPPRRGQIKAKIMSKLVRMVGEAGRAMCSKEKVGEEPHPSQTHDSSHL